MQRAGVDVLLVSVGSDLPYLTGYEAMPLERLTMLVVPRDGEATLVIPRLEAPRVVEQPGVFTLLPWGETDDPVAIVAGLVGRPAVAAVGDTMWARFLVELLGHWPTDATRYVRSTVGDERPAHAQGRRRDRRAAGCRRRCRSGGRAAARRRHPARRAAPRPQVSADISARLIAEGHDVVNFAIVAAGENAASPHHHAGDRVIREGEIVLCDFGGTMDGYCSDITRCVSLGEPPAEVAEAYAVLHEAQAAGVAAGVVGAACQDVDRAVAAHHRRRRLRRVLHPPHRPRHRHGGARRPVHGGGQRRCPSRPGTRSASSRASTCRASGACAWKTSWSRPPTARCSMNHADHALVTLG